MSEQTIQVAFGYKRIVTTQEVVGTRLYLGGYSITYDLNGNEVSRTENQWSGYLEFAPD